MGKTAEGYGSCAKGCTCPRHESAAPAGAWHFRNHDDGRIYEALPNGSVRPLSGETEERARPPQASELPPGDTDQARESWWDDDEPEPARDYTLSDEGPPNPARDVAADDEPTVISWAQKRELRRNATREDKEAFRRADEELQENSYREKKAGIRHETDEYLRLNDKVWRLGRKIGKW